MKKVLKIILYITIAMILFVVSDLYIFRGNFSHLYISPSSDGFIDFKNSESDELELKISKQSDRYKLTFKNKSIKPFFVWTFRNDETFFKVNDTIFSAHYRLILDVPGSKNKYEYGLGCGTGLGHFSINPFEKFSSEVNQNQLLNCYYWGAYHQNYKTGDTINDLLYNKPLLVVNRKENTFKTFQRNDITNRDSIKAHLYIPIFSYNQSELYYIKSNKIKLSYKKIIEKMIIEESQVFKQIYD